MPDMRRPDEDWPSRSSSRLAQFQHRNAVSPIETSITKGMITTITTTKSQPTNELRRLSIKDSTELRNSGTVSSPRSGKLQKSPGGSVSSSTGSVSRKRSLRYVVRRFLGHQDNISEDLIESPLEDHSLFHMNAFADASSGTQSSAVSMTGLSTVARSVRSPPLPLSSAHFHPRLGLPSARESREMSGRRSSLPTQRKLEDKDFSAHTSISPIGANSDTEIGMAITSAATLRRRSRSVGELRAVAARAYTYRRLEDEKNYWRQSYAVPALFHGKKRDAVQLGQVTMVSEPEECERTAVEDFPIRPVSRAEGDDVGLAEHQHRLMTAHDSPMMGSGKPNLDGSMDMSLQYRIAKLEQMMSEFQQPLDALSKAKRKSVTFETPSESPRSSNQPMPEDSRLLFFIKIINEERAKRRQLERQVNALQQDLSEMRFQLSQPIMSRQSRIYGAHQMRFRNASTHSRGPSYASAYDGATHQNLASRFSMTESLAESEAIRMHRQSLGHGEEVVGEITSEPSTPFEFFNEPDPMSDWKRTSGGVEMF